MYSFTRCLHAYFTVLLGDALAAKEDEDAEITCGVFQLFAPIYQHYITAISFSDKGCVMNFLRPPQMKNN